MKSIKFSDRYPIIVTPHKNACREFWVRHLGFEVGFDAAWFCWLHGGDGSASIAFMTPDHPSAPPGPAVFSGQRNTRPPHAKHQQTSRRLTCPKPSRCRPLRASSPI